MMSRTGGRSRLRFRVYGMGMGEAKGRVLRPAVHSMDCVMEGDALVYLAAGR